MPRNIRDGWSSKNCFQPLQRRELTGKFPNSFGDYQLQAFNTTHDFGGAKQLLISEDIIFVSFRGMDRPIIPFGKNGTILSPLTNDSGDPIVMKYSENVISMFYNDHNNSLIIVHKHSIISLDIASIKAGRTNQYTELCADEDICYYDIDVPNCRALIYSGAENQVKVFDLKEYSHIFTTPVECYNEWNAYCQSSGNMYLLMDLEGIWEISGEVWLDIYSKVDGLLLKETILHLHSKHKLKFVTFSGADRLLVQQQDLTMEIFDISGDIPQIIQTNIEARFEPYYLEKWDRFLVFTESESLHVCNQRGDIIMTFEDHQIRVPHFKFYKAGTYISRRQDIVISACLSDESSHYTINISSIITGKCLLKITSQNGSQIRDDALESLLTSLVYDERTGEIFSGNNNGICCVWSKRFPFDIALPTMTISFDEDDDHNEGALMRMMIIMRALIMRVWKSLMKMTR